MAGQFWVTGSLGGVWANPRLSAQMRSAAQSMQRFRGFAYPEKAFGKKRSDRFLFDKFGNLQTKGGTVPETSTVPMTQFPTVQGSLTVTEYANKVPFTGKLDALAEFDVSDVTQRRLMEDMGTVLDSAVAVQFYSADYVAVCTNTASVIFTSNGTATATASADLTASNVRSVISFMKKKLIPKWKGQEHFMCINSVQSIDALYASLEGVEQYTEASVEDFANGTFYEPLKGERGRYFGTRFIEETNFLSNTIGSGTAFGEAIFFGDDPVIEGVAIPEEIRAEIPSDLGRSQALGWYFLGGFQKVWSISAGDIHDRIVAVKSA